MKKILSIILCLIIFQTTASASVSLVSNLSTLSMGNAETAERADFFQDLTMREAVDTTINDPITMLNEFTMLNDMSNFLTNTYPDDFNDTVAFNDWVMPFGMDAQTPLEMTNTLNEEDPITMFSLDDGFDFNLPETDTEDNEEIEYITVQGVIIDFSSDGELEEEETKNYYLRTEDQTYLLDTEDRCIDYFLSLIVNKGYKVSLTANKLSSFRLQVVHISMVDELPEEIWEEYTKYCEEIIDSNLPVGVIFTKEEEYYCSFINTSSMFKVKTNEEQLSILIPIIADKGIKMNISYSQIDSDTIYINNVILKEDLPNDLAEQFKNEYTEFMKTNTHNFMGYIDILNNNYCLVTNNGIFLLYTEDADIRNYIFNNNGNKNIINITGYLDLNSGTITAIKLTF